MIRHKANVVARAGGSRAKRCRSIYGRLSDEILRGDGTNKAVGAESSRSLMSDGTNGKCLELLEQMIDAVSVRVLEGESALKLFNICADRQMI